VVTHFAAGVHAPAHGAVVATGCVMQDDHGWGYRAAAFVRGVESPLVESSD
jgi:hypothetical protein